MSAQKQKGAWGTSEKIKNEGSWCMVNGGGEGPVGGGTGGSGGCRG